MFEYCPAFFSFLEPLEKSLKVRDLLAKYRGTAIIIICINLAIAFGIHITSIKKYTILVDKAVHINEIVKYDTHLIFT
jgi:hypothetical protein